MKISSLDLPNIESLESVPEELPEGVEVTELMHGLKTWINPINGYRVLRIHYSVDPARRTQEWKERERKKMGTAEWLREEELIWESMQGRAVYADTWNYESHVSKQSLGWNPKLPVCRGWDFGLNGACLFAQLLPASRLYILREAVSEDIGFERFAEEVNRLSVEWFPGARFIEFVDPTGHNRFGSDERSYMQILTSRPLVAKRLVMGANSFVERKKAVEAFLKDSIRGQMCYLVDPSCEVLIKGFNGGYFHAYSRGGVLRDRPEKNFSSHIHDANQYLCSKVKNVKLDMSDRKTKVVEPRYTTTQRREQVIY